MTTRRADPDSSRVVRAALRRGMQLVAGSAAIGAGAAVILTARLGADGYSVLLAGAARVGHTSFGVASTAVGTALVALWCVLGRRLPGVGSVTSPTIVGVTVNLLLPVLPQPHGLSLRLLVAAVGAVAIGVGVGLYVGAKLGPGGLDGLAVVLAERLPRIGLGRVYTVLLVASVAVGAWCGAPVGVATLAAAFIVGPVADATLRRVAYTPPADRAPDRPTAEAAPATT